MSSVLSSTPSLSPTGVPTVYLRLGVDPNATASTAFQDLLADLAPTHFSQYVVPLNFVQVVGMNRDGKIQSSLELLKGASINHSKLATIRMLLWKDCGEQIAECLL